MSAWAIPTILSIVLVAGLTTFVVRRRPPPVLWPALLTAHVAALVFGIGDLVTSHLATEPVLDWIGLLVLYAGITAVGPAWWILAVRFADLHGRPFRFGRSRWIHAPSVAVAVLYCALLTNPWHGLFLTPQLSGRSEYHTLWWISAGLGYLLLAAALAAHLVLARRAPSPAVRSQAMMMAAATTMPPIGNMLYVFAENAPPFDPTVMGLCAACALFIVGIYRRQLFTLSPIALAEILRRESDGIVVVGTEGRALYVNPAAARLFPEAELEAGRPAFEALAPLLREPTAPAGPLSAEELAHAACDPGRPPGGRLYRFGERGKRWLRIEATPIPARRARLAGHSLRLRDETALHGAMDAVEDQASVLAATLAATNEALLVIALDGTIRYFNERWRELLGLPDWVRPGLHVDSLRVPLAERLADPDTVSGQVASTRRDPLLETLNDFELRDGRVLESASQPLLRNGVISGRVWRLRDITEQRRSEAAVRHAQKLESLGVMAGGIAHDFNNLLAVVMGNASLALEEIPRDTIAAACLEDVKKASERAGELTEQLLAYAGKGELELEEIDVSRLVRDVAELISVSIPKGVMVRYRLEERLPAVTGDASQLRQIVMNLIMNGAEAVGEGDGSVTVETGCAPGPDPRVLLRVSDTGCGMDEATRARIFDPFFSTKFAGRGLGLAATLGIVSSHRGSLRVESEPGRGSSFTVLLPCRDAPARAVASSAQPPPWRGRGTVLVVDDDDAVRAMASRILHSAGLAVLSACDGVEALRVYREHGEGIDAVLLDVTMPHMNGERAWRALREIDPAVRVVLSSGYPEREVSRSLRGEEGLLFVHKPYEKRDLVERMREALGA